MLKIVLRYIISFGLLFLIGFYVHEYMLSSNGIQLDFSLFRMYVFHAVFSFGICALLLTFSKRQNLFPQLGFLYLGGFLLKFFIFVIVFRRIILGESILTVIDSISLMVPIVLFLGLEVYFVANLLQVIDTEQK